jgi:hypothetical protein
MKQMNHSEYQRKCKTMSVESLLYVIKDCQEALTANPDCANASYYSDEICYCGMELANRRRAKQLILIHP